MIAVSALVGLSGAAGATGFTTTVPGTGVQLPDEYPEAGGVAIVMTGVNGNIYYQFSDPDGAFRGFQFRGQPSRFRGNPFTINDPINLDCGFRSCTDYFGGAIARIDIRFSAFDGDTQPGGFDNNNINLLLNGFDVGSWSGLQTEITNTTGTNSFGFATGFGNNTFNTGWFSSTNAALLGNILATNSTTTQVLDDDPDDNFWDFTRGPSLPRDDLRTIAPGYEFEKTLRNGETAFLEVGEVYTYDYVVRNIGSVDIEDITVVDDRIATVSCPANNDLDAVPAGSPEPNQLICSGTYRITQEDVDAGEVTNIARANGTPEFGQLGEVEDTRTLTGPAFNDAVTLEKIGSPDPFGDAGSEVTYDLTVTNTGNTTLRNVIVTDPRLPQLSCTIPTLLPLSADNTDNTETCQATYQVTQPDVDAFIQSGTPLTNTASVTATGADGTATDTASDTLNGPAAAPALTVVKTSPTPSYAAVGDIIEYRIAVTNNGNVTWPGPPTITDVLTDGATCPAGPISPNATVTCTATYAVDQPDLDAGSRDNTASAAITVGGQTANGSDSTTVDADLRPALEVVKALSSGPNPFDALNQQLVYQYEVSNTGNVVVNAPTISDDRITASCAATTIPAGQSVICTSDPYVIDQDDLDLGSVTNVASATADVPGGGTVTSPDASLTVPSDAAPAFTLTKVSTDSFTAVDDLVTYTLSVTNPGPLTLSSVTVSDPLVPGFSCTLTNVAPDNTPQDCPTQAEYTVIQEDLDRGFIDNTATAVGTATTGTQVTETASERVEPTVGALTRSLDLLKTASPETFAGPGETITYTLAVENTGTQTLTNVVVEDPTLGLTCTIASIAPTLTDNSCTGTRLTTADDFDAGTFVNDAVASADGVPNVPGQATITATGRNADFELTKTADMTGFAQVGDRIRFTLSIQNTGNVSVNAITLTDELFDPNLTCSIAKLPVGATDTSCFGTYTVQQADIDRGSVTNDADAVGTGADGATLVDDTQTTINGPARNPSVSVEKIERDGSGDFVSGVAENYDFTVRNTGNVTLAAGGTITDGLTGFTCPLPELAPGAETTTCQNGDPLTTQFTPGQPEVDSGSLANTVDVSASAVGGGTATASDTVTLNGPTQLPDVELSKRSDPVNATYAAVGDQIDYLYDVLNTGNVTITEPITIADDRVSVTCQALPPGGLAPGSTLQCTAAEIVTLTELDAGSVVNTATAAVTQGVVPSATYPDGLAVIESDPASETVNAVQAPALSLVKRIKPGTPSTYDGPGDLGDAGNANNLIFEFLVTNTGNVTTTAPILLEDFNIPANITCAPLGVAPGETIACEAPWAPTQTQVNDGSFDNDAEATTEFAGATTTSNRDTATATAIRRPELATTKALAGISGGSFAARATITYDYTVTNTGNVTVDGPIEIDDNLIPRFACQAGPLLPGATATCSGDYIITANDVDQFGSVTNIATGLGTTPQGPVESDPVSLTVPPGANPSLQIVKAITPANTEITTEGQVLTYVFTVTNNSSGTFPPAFNDNITVTDSRIGTFPCPLPLVGVGPTLNVGESYQCTATDIVDQADLDAVSADQMMGFVTNSAVANSIFGGAPVVSNAAVVTVPGAANDVLAVEKTATPRAPATAPVAAGDIIDYSVVVRNDGNRTLTNVIVRDPRIPGLSCDVAAPISLAPDALTTCTGAYTVEQADIDTQSLTNTASAEGAAPDGTVVAGQGDAVVAVEEDAPLLEVIKTVVGGSTGTDFTDPGQPLTFLIEVRNIGNVTIDGVNVTDSLVSGSCAVGTLAPGDNDTSCEFEYIVTQDNINIGEVNNTATAIGTARTPDAETVSDDGDAQATGPDREPSIAVSKTGAGPLADGRFDADEQVLNYEFVLLNTGNVTLEGPVTVTDSVIGPIDCAPVFPANGLLPAEAITCIGSYEVDQIDVDRGEVTNGVDVSIADPTDPLNNPPIIADTSLTIESDRRPSFAVTKVADPTTMVMAGDDITYTYTVTNTGNVTLTDVVLDDQQTSASGTDPLDIEDDGEIASLAPGVAVTLTATYEVTQADIDAGNALTNTVTVEAVPPAGLLALDPETADASVTPETGTGGLEVRKTVRTPPAAPEAGQTVIFEVQVENTGNVTLDAITQTETVLRADGVPATGTPLVIFEGGDTGATADAIDVDETWIYRVEYTLEQLDVDARGITNSIRFDATDPQDGPVFDVSDSGTGAGDAPTPLVLTPSSSLEVLKTVRTPAGTTPNAGDTVVFEIRVENTGQTTLSAPVLDDDLTRADGLATALQPEPIFETGDTGAIPDSLDVDETWVYRVEYVLDQADIDAGGLSNTVVATANPPTGPPINDTSDDGTGGAGGSTPTTIPLAGEPQIETIKRVLGPIPARPLPDDLLQFEITVRNAGNVTLTAPTLTDVLIPTGGSALDPAPVPMFDDGDTDGDGSLSVGETWVYILDFPLTQSVIDAGGLTNQVTATTAAPDGTVIGDPSDPNGPGDAPTPVTLPRDPGITGLKTITNAPLLDGDVVRFEITATNTGNTTLTAVSVPSDTLTRADNTPLTLTAEPQFVSNNDGSPQGTLRPGETATFRATYILQQEDIDAGGIRNQAQVSGTPPGLPPVSDLTGNSTPGGEDEPTELTIIADPSLSLVKRLVSGGPSVSAVDDPLVYAFDVTNTGNVTAAAISITDQRLIDAGVAVVCPPTLLAPDASLTCEATYLVTQDDLDADPPTLSNSATATDGIATSDPSTVDVAVQQMPGLSTEKEAVSVEFEGTTFGPGVPPAQFRVGAVVNYLFTVTNTGNITLRDEVTIDDNLIDVICDPLPTEGLRPTLTVECTGTHLVTSDDVDLASVTNLATATSGTTDSPPTSETVPNDGTPNLGIVKTLTSGDEFSAVDDVLTYQFEVTNTGEVAFTRDIIVQDTLLDDDVVCFTASAADPDFAAGETVTCEGTYLVKQEDLDRGEVLNAANAQTTFGDSNREVVSPPSNVTATADPNPELTLTKTVATLPVTAVDQVLTYTLVAENTGNQTLRLVEVTDQLLPDLFCSIAELAPGASLSCSSPYTVTQDNFDAPALVNTASATSVDPAGDPAEDTDSVTVNMPAATPSLIVVKSAQPEPFGPEGSIIEYRFRLENTGNVTLRDVTVVDELVDPPFECVVAELRPDTVDDSTCVLGYPVTQDDVDRGSILNTANATSVPARGEPPTATDTVSVRGATAEPSLSAEKRASIVGEPAVDSVVTYTLEVINTGNVTLAVTGIEDTITRDDGTSATLNAPFAFVDGDANGDGRLGLREVWIWTAQYTITQADIDAGGFENSATVNGTAPDGAPVSDISDDGIDDDGNTSDDPTRTAFIRVPAIEVIKSITTPGAVAGDVVLYEITATNTGNTTLADLEITDTLTDVGGASVTPEAPPALVGPPAAALSLAPGDSVTYELPYTLTQSDIDAGGLSNTATVSSRAPDLQLVSDVSDDANPAAGNGDADPTVLLIESDPSATLEKTAGDVRRAGGTLFDVPFTLTAANTGNVTLTGLSLTDDLAAFAAPARVVSVTGLTVSGLTEGGANTSYDGLSDIETLDAAATLAPDAVVTVTFTVRLDTADGAPANPNTVTLASDQLDEDLNASVRVNGLSAPALVVTKSVSPAQALIGDTVTYTIQVENTGGFTESDLSIVDELPAGLVYTPDTARLDTVLSEPAIAGRTQSWAPVTLAPSATTTVTLQVRVTDGPGEFVNRAFVRDPFGAIVSNVATAVLQVRPEAVFDCGDVIGRVFDDVDLDGYYDGDADATAGVSDQTYDASKGGVAPAQTGPRAERGLPRVRIATVDGSIITTDEHGRFNVPCALLPRDIGSNFTLKLDPSSLPTGYHVTTENPRTVRLTPGRLAKMNFGAALADVVDIALTAEAFSDVAPSRALRDGLAAALPQLAEAPVILRLTYRDAGEGGDVARARLDAVEALIREGWPRGRTRPVIERTLVRGN